MSLHKPFIGASFVYLDKYDRKSHRITSCTCICLKLCNHVIKHAYLNLASNWSHFQPFEYMHQVSWMITYFVTMHLSLKHYSIQGIIYWIMMPKYNVIHPYKAFIQGQSEATQSLCTIRNWWWVDKKQFSIVQEFSI